MAHRLDCPHILTLCDQAFVLKCGALEHQDLPRVASANTCLTAGNVAGLHACAQRLQLPGEDCFMVWMRPHQTSWETLCPGAGLKAECIAYLGQHFKEVPDDQLPAGMDDELALFVKHLRPAYSLRRKTLRTDASREGNA